MDPERQKQIASRGGKVAHQRKTAHEFTSEEARLAGKKGGDVTSRDRTHMAEIGRLGAVSRRKRHIDEVEVAWWGVAEER